MAGIVGPMLVSWVRETTGDYTTTLNIFAGLFAAALITSILMILNVQKHRGCDRETVLAGHASTNIVAAD